jgi:MoaA/NifB/PqqE/SkfB family radical SAM enzyme
MSNHLDEDVEQMRAYSINYSRAEKIAKAFEANTPLKEMSGRGVVFLTEKCNLNCLYCKTKKISEPDVALEDALAKINEWSAAGCKFLHLTGGEVTTYRGLHEIVGYAKDKGMVTSISTNGTADALYYEKLVSSGAKYFYISLDSDNEEEFDLSVGRPEAFDRVITAIKYLVRMRDFMNKDIYLTINCMIYRENFSRIADIVHFIESLCPDDFKLIPTTKFMSSLTHEHETKIKELLESEEANKDKFHFFHYRLRHFSHMRGLKDEKYKGTRCYICVDERTIGPDGYYPCSIYFREKGKPTGCYKEDDFQTQSRRLFEWAKTHDPSQDPICSEFCCDITRDFNLAVHRILKKS